MDVAACLAMCCPKKETPHPPDPSPPNRRISSIVPYGYSLLLTLVYGIRERAREREREEGWSESKRARDREIERSREMWREGRGSE